MLETETAVRVLSTAYDAWWFLYDHPKLNTHTRIEVESEDGAGKDYKDWPVLKDRNGNFWQECPVLFHHALEENLDIIYEKDETKGNAIGCYLEIGPIEWGYHTDWETGREYRIHFHDVDLDCGGPTFDAALVKLAGLVLEKYGDY